MPTIHLFSGKIQCEVCGHSPRYFKVATPYFRCMTRKYVGECSCMSGRIKEDELAVTVLSAIRLYVKALLDERALQEQGNEVVQLARATCYNAGGQGEIQGTKGIIV